jgi:hypothetical protein
MTHDLTYQPGREIWEGRFLVPHEVKDGPYDVQIFVTDRQGSLTATTTSYVIDSRSPAFTVSTTEEHQGLRLLVEGDEELREVRVSHVGGQAPLRLSGHTCSRDGCRLSREDLSRFLGIFELSPGTHTLRVVVTDQARNESVREITVVVKGEEEEEGC